MVKQNTGDNSISKQRFVTILKEQGYVSASINSGIPTVTCPSCEMEDVITKIDSIAKSYGYGSSWAVQTKEGGSSRSE